MGWFSDFNRRIRGKPTRSEEGMLAKENAKADLKKDQNKRSAAFRSRRSRAGGFGSGFGNNPWG